MQSDEREVHAVWEWLEDAWRHGEVVAEQDGCVSGSAPGRHPRARHLAHQVQRALRATRAVLHAGPRA